MKTSVDMSAPIPWCWAYDSHNKELDPKLKAAHRFALQEVCPSTAERTEPIVLRNLLDDEQIEALLANAARDGVWPRGVAGRKEKPETVSPVMLPPPCHRHRFVECLEEFEPSQKVGIHEDLKSVAHHFAWTDEHVALYMQNNDHWFVRTNPVPWSIIRGGMESHPDQEGVPVLADEWIGSDQSMNDVRTVELHHYATGGSLITPGHRDCGSELTISVLLSDPAKVSGGDFVTYSSSEDRAPIAHQMGRGDAILFCSEKLHNISTVTRGVRQSLVVELWPSKRY